MPHPFDATSKHLLQPRPADWLALGGLPPGTSLEVVDADLSTLSTAADKLIRVNGPKPYGAHVEFQAGPDRKLDERMLVYHVMGRHRLKMRVLSVVFLLRPEALTPGVLGGIFDDAEPDHELKFRYKLVKVWEIPVEKLLSGGLGTLPLAPISAVVEPALPGVIEAMKRRLDSEVPPEEARELWTATRILMGLRWPPDLVGQLLKGVQGMKESATYQEIVREGFEQGIEKGIEKGIQQGIEKGIEQGRAAEAKSVLLRRGAKLLGPPEAAVRARLEAIADLRQLEELMDSMLDGTCATWGELLGPEA